MINDFLFENMDDIDQDEMWFQQDGATCHTAVATIDLLKSKFGDKLISRNGPVNWPARSCDSLSHYSCGATTISCGAT